MTRALVAKAVLAALALGACATPTLPYASPRAGVSNEPASALHPAPEPAASESESSTDTIPTVVSVGPLSPSFRVDGELDEWTAAPAFEAPGVRLWLSAGTAGLAIALEIRDASIGAERSGGAPVVRVAHRMPELPPLGFKNQFGLVELESEAWCDEAERMENAEARAGCKVWYAEQLSRRAAIAREFVREYPLDASGHRRAEQRRDGLHRIEALLEPSELPALTGRNLTSLLLELRLPSQRSKPISLDARLDVPVAFVVPGSLSYEMLGHEQIVPGELVAFYAPARPDVLHYLLNAPRGYQSQPGEPSPAQVVVDLSQRTVIGRHGNLLLERVLATPGFAGSGGHILVSSRGGVVVDTVDIGSSVVKGPALRAGGLELLVANDGPANALGVGVCGACTNYRVESLTVRSDGTFGELVELVSHLVTDDQTMDLTIAPDLSTVVLRGDQVDHSTEPPRVEGFELRLTWSPAQGEYVARKRSVAARPIP